MAWEDCVVDVHSVKFSQDTLESMFSKCGAVRNVIHWKGQGEKQHVFLEYKSPSAAESARTLGLDRSDLQVIKLSNNEMLKRKFRELEKLSGNRARSTCSYSELNPDMKVDLKDYNLPAKPPFISTYPGAQDAEGKYRSLDSECSKTRHGQSGSSSTPFLTSSYSSSRSAGRSGVSQDEPSRLSSSDSMKGLALPKPNSTCVQDPMKTDVSESRSMRVPVTDHENRNISVNEALLITPGSSPSSPPRKGFTAPISMLKKSDIWPTVIEIPHAGEVIKFDLEKQLEPNPAGIICMLSNVKADQKLWMMTAAYYNGKHNLEAAREVLEAGIDMAAQIGAEADTKPFWHLLSQINSSLKAGASAGLSALSLSPTTSASMLFGTSCNQNSGAPIPKKNDTSVSVSPSMKEESHLLNMPNNPVRVPLHALGVLSNAPEVDTTMPNKPYTLPYHHSAPFPHHAWPGDRESHRNPCAASPILPSGPMDTSARLHSLQSEIGILREKQTVVLEDLSIIRAAKRRAEDEVKEERSIRRKLEKHLRAAEDALARSKRMEDAALDQVKREVEARRKVEELLAVTKAEKDKAGGASLFANTSVNDAAMLLQLASMMRSVSSNDVINPWQPGRATSGTGAASSTASQSET